MKVKRRLAEAAVDYLRDRKDPIKSVVFGSGVTVYRAAESLLVREGELQVEEVFSSNVLVLFAFAYYKPHNMVLKVAAGQLDPATAWLQTAGIGQLGDRSVDAVVVSFMHLTKKGFWTRQPYDPWQSEGATSFADRLRTRVTDILATHQPQPLDESLSREIDRIVASAKRELG